MDEFSLMIYLEPGLNIIKPSVKYESKEGCGLIPIGQRVEKIVTSGFMYNMGN